MYNNIRHYLQSRWVGKAKTRLGKVELVRPSDDKAVVGTAGINAIIAIIRDDLKNPYYSPPSFGGYEVNNREGKIAKRIAKAVKLTYGEKLSNHALSLIGEVAERYSVKPKDCFIDFDKTLRWRSGAYGDSGSCFWGGRSHDRVALRECYEAWALRFYEPCDDQIDRWYEGRQKYYYRYGRRKVSAPSSWPAGYAGFARSWTVPDYPYEWCMVVTNAYGMRIEHQANTLQILLETISEQPYIVRSITLGFDNPYSNRFYVNNSPKLLIPEKMQSKVKDGERVFLRSKEGVDIW